MIKIIKVIKEDKNGAVTSYELQEDKGGFNWLMTSLTVEQIQELKTELNNMEEI